MKKSTASCFESSINTQYENNYSNCVNNVLFKRKTTLIVWRQQNKGKDLLEEILNDIVKYNLYIEFVFFKKCEGEGKRAEKCSR